MRRKTGTILVLALLLMLPTAWWVSPYYGEKDTWETALYWHRPDSDHGISRPLFVIRVEGKQGFININGEVVIQPRFEKVYRFTEGLAAAKSGSLWGFIDERGDWVIRPQFSRGSLFREGRAEVCFQILGPFGFIDKAGTVVVTPQFDYTSDYIDGVARVGFRTPWGKLTCFLDIGSTYRFRYIDKSGNYVPKPPMNNPPGARGELVKPIKTGDTITLSGGDVVVGWVYEPRDGLVQFTVVDELRVGYVDLAGNIVWSPTK